MLSGNVNLRLAAKASGRLGRLSMALNGDDDYEWEPPTEAEMKVLEAQRERQNKISKLMGDYLLKGYKMLGDCCQHCSTILLEDRQKNIYCVACQELDSDVDKDNPALNAQAALSQVRERQLAFQTPPQQQPNGSSTPPPSSAPRPIRTLPRPEHCEGAASGGRATGGRPVTAPVTTPAAASWSPNSTAAAPQDPPSSASPIGGAAVVQASGVSATVQGGGILQHTLNEAEQALLAKLQWASTQLDHAPSVETSIQLCQLIASCATSLRSLRELHRD